MKLRIDYFKPSGKWYHRVNHELHAIYGHEAVSQIRNLNSIGHLPGLASGKWDGPIMVTEVEYDLPYLILP